VTQLVSAERAAALLNKCLSLAKTCSIGFRSGEYFGSRRGEAWGRGPSRIDPEALTVDWTLEYRAMTTRFFAPGMHNRAYYHRYTDDNVDLCDVLSSFSYGAKVKLDDWPIRQLPRHRLLRWSGPL